MHCVLTSKIQNVRQETNVQNAKAKRATGKVDTRLQHTTTDNHGNQWYSDCQYFHSLSVFSRKMSFFTFVILMPHLHERHETVTVVGAGLVGTLAAIMLAQRNYTVHVFERRPDLRITPADRGHSINMALSHRGRRALEAACVATDVESVGIPMYGRMIHNLDSSVVFQQYGKVDEAIYSVSRAKLNATLLDYAAQLPNVHLHFDQRFMDATFDTATAQFQDGTGSVRTVEADHIIAADGAYSSVRFKMQKLDRFNYEQLYLEHGYKELAIPANATDRNNKWRIEQNALHIWPRGKYMLVALPNLDGSFTCTLFLPFEGEPSFERLASGELVQQFFTEVFPDTAPLMPRLLDDFAHNPTSSLVTIKCAPWTYRDKIALVGDAAHAIVPFYGQGMNSGFEDCQILMECLDAHNHDWSVALHEYHTLRKANGDAIAQLARQNFVEMSEKVADPKFLLRKKIEKRIHELYPDTFLPVYSMVTFSHVPYVDAMQENKRQDALFERIMALPKIEQQWTEEEGEMFIRRCVEELYAQK